MKKEDFEKEFSRLTKGTKACVLIRTEVNSEMPMIGVEGDPKEILWGLAFALANVLKRSANDPKTIKGLTKHTYKLIDKLVEEEDED